MTIIAVLYHEVQLLTDRRRPLITRHALPTLQRALREAVEQTSSRLLRVDPTPERLRFCVDLSLYIAPSALVQLAMTLTAQAARDAGLLRPLDGPLWDPAFQITTLQHDAVLAPPRRDPFATQPPGTPEDPDLTLLLPNAATRHARAPRDTTLIDPREVAGLRLQSHGNPAEPKPDAPRRPREHNDFDAPTVCNPWSWPT